MIYNSLINLYINHYNKPLASVIYLKNYFKKIFIFNTYHTETPLVVLIPEETKDVGDQFLSHTHTHTSNNYIKNTR